MGKPERITIDHDDYHAQHIGRLGDGRQFFLTQPFRPARTDDPGCEFVALFLFRSDGAFDTATIESFGPRSEVDGDALVPYTRELLASLPEPTFQRIEVRPFSVTKFGTEFGLITREPEEEGDAWAVELLPGNYMAFFEPWDSGVYDT